MSKERSLTLTSVASTARLEVVRLAEVFWDEMLKISFLEKNGEDKSVIENLQNELIARLATSVREYSLQQKDLWKYLARLTKKIKKEVPLTIEFPTFEITAGLSFWPVRSRHLFDTEPGCIIDLETGEIKSHDFDLFPISTSHTREDLLGHMQPASSIMIVKHTASICSYPSYEGEFDAIRVINYFQGILKAKSFGFKE